MIWGWKVRQGLNWESRNDRRKDLEQTDDDDNEIFREAREVAPLVRLLSREKPRKQQVLYGRQRDPTTQNSLAVCWIKPPS